MPRKSHFAALICLTWAAWPTCSSVAQQPAATTPAATSDSGGDSRRSWIVRDPTTGRVFQQEVVSQTVATTQWELRPVTTTIYEPRSVVKSVPSQQTTYVPSTQYVMQPKLRGWWNPLSQPVQTYQFVPVTSWQPQTQMVNNPVATVEWVPRQQIVYVSQPVQRMQTQQQIVSKELPQPASSVLPPLNPPTMLAAQGRPLVTIPILAQQRMLPWPSGAPAQAMRNVVGNGLRPIAPAFTPSYSPPLQTASSAAGPLTRDPMQSGMAATVLR